jgi:hypothetical protein
VREAARRRDGAGLACLERALAFLAGGHTAGESELLQRLLEVPPGELATRLARLPAATPRWEALEARLTGVVLFEPAPAPPA